MPCFKHLTLALLGCCSLALPVWAGDADIKSTITLRDGTRQVTYQDGVITCFNANDEVFTGSACKKVPQRKKEQIAQEEAQRKAEEKQLALEAKRNKRNTSVSSAGSYTPQGKTGSYTPMVGMYPVYSTNRTTYHVMCNEGGAAFAAYTAEFPEVYHWGGNISGGSEYGLSLDQVLRKACRN